MSKASPAIFSNFFGEQSRQNHPQYLSGLSRELFPTTFLETDVYSRVSIKRDSFFELQILSSLVTLTPHEMSDRSVYGGTPIYGLGLILNNYSSSPNGSESE